MFPYPLLKKTALTQLFQNLCFLMYSLIFFNYSLVVEQKTGDSVCRSLAMSLRSSHAHKQPL